MLSKLLFLPSLLALLPEKAFQDLIRCLQAPRQFWAAPKEHGLWEKDVCGMWQRMGQRYPDWDESQARVVEQAFDRVSGK